MLDKKPIDGSANVNAQGILWKQFLSILPVVDLDTDLICFFIQ